MGRGVKNRSLGDRVMGLVGGGAQAEYVVVADAGVEPGDVDVVFADAAAIHELDRVEADAVTNVFGPEAVAVTAPKTMTGRLLSGAASLDVAAALLSVRDGVIPPTAHVTPDPAYRLGLVTGRARQAEVSCALVLARGNGGFNSAMVVRRSAA